MAGKHSKKNRRSGKAKARGRALGLGGSAGAFLAFGLGPMAGAPPLFVGDDLTDEAGFAAAEQAGGAGILVGAARETAASYGLADVAAVHSWLGQLVEPCSGKNA